MDYARSRRIKLWGTIRIVEDDTKLIEQLRDRTYPGKVERAILFQIDAWDVNCPQHIPQRFEASDVQAAIRSRDERIAKLEAEVEGLRRPVDR